MITGDSAIAAALLSSGMGDGMVGGEGEVMWGDMFSSISSTISTIQQGMSEGAVGVVGDGGSSVLDGDTSSVTTAVTAATSSGGGGVVGEVEETAAESGGMFLWKKLLVRILETLTKL